MALSSPDLLLLRQGFPVRVEWQGWETDTYRLSRCGWKMAAHEDYVRDEMNVVFKNGDTLLEGEVEGYRRLMSMVRQNVDFWRHVVIRIRRVLSIERTTMISVGEPYKDFAWRDMEPSETVMRERQYRMQDLQLFRELEKPLAQELIIAPEQVQEALDLILKVQSPGMKEIRAREARRERDQPEVKQVHAQIISLRAA